MKKKTTWLLFVLFACAALVISGCDMNNPVTDEWWVGEGEEEGGNTGTGGGGGGGGGGLGTKPVGGGTSTSVIPITTYTVNFNIDPDKYEEYFDALNGNSDSIKSQALKEGELVQEPGLVIIDEVLPNDGHHDASPVPTKFFAGWYPTTSGGTPWDFNSAKVDKTADQADGKEDGIINLYPRWNNNGFTVTFEPGGDFDKNSTLNVDDADDEIDWSDTIYHPEPEYVTSDVPLVPLSEPKGFGLKTGDSLVDDYVFTGWYIDVTGDKIVGPGDTKWDFTKLVTGNMKLYAGWGTKTAGGVIPPENMPITPLTPVHTVTFDGNGVPSPAAEKVFEGKLVPRPNAIYKTGEAFTGWHVDSATGALYTFNTPLTGDITLVAGWANTDFTVIFKSNGGDYIDLVNDPDNNDPNYLNPPDQRVRNNSKEVYEPGLVKGPSDRPYLDGWYTVPGDTGGTKWLFNSATGTSADETYDVVNGSGDDGNIELYARWSNSGSEVRFAPGGDFDQNGTLRVDDTDDEIDWSDTTYEPLTEYVASGVPLSQPKGFGLKPGDPLADDYVFTGWYKDVNGNGIVDTDDEKWDFTRTDHGNMTLYAGWGTKKANGDVIPPEEGGTPTPVYTISFNDYGADNPTPAQKLVPDETVVLGDPEYPLPRPDAIFKKNYVFSGWYKDAGLNTLWDFSTETVGEDDDTFGGGADDNSFTLYAKWELQPYTEPWFDDEYALYTTRENNLNYFPFQCDTGDASFANTGDGEGPDYTTSYDNMMTVIETLKNHRNYVALIVGYADPGTADGNIEKLIADRETTTWDLLRTETGVNEEQLIVNTKLPPGYPSVPSGMIVGPNEREGKVGPDGNEVRVYIYQPR